MNTGLRLNGHAQTGSNRASESKHRCHDGCHPLACFWNLWLQIRKKSSKLNQMCTDKNCRVCKHLETGNVEVLLRKDQTGMYQCSFEKKQTCQVMAGSKKSFSKSYSKAQPGCVIYEAHAQAMQAENMAKDIERLTARSVSQSVPWISMNKCQSCHVSFPMFSAQALFEHVASFSIQRQATHAQQHFSCNFPSWNARNRCVHSSVVQPQLCI